MMPKQRPSDDLYKGLLANFKEALLGNANPFMQAHCPYLDSGVIADHVPQSIAGKNDCSVSGWSDANDGADMWLPTQAKMIHLKQTLLGDALRERLSRREGFFGHLWSLCNPRIRNTYKEGKCSFRLELCVNSMPALP